MGLGLGQLPWTLIERHQSSKLRLVEGHGLGLVERHYHMEPVVEVDESRCAEVAERNGVH